MGARVHLCGRLAVEWDGKRIEDALPGRQGRLLFAYLTLHRRRPVHRDELIEALWPGTSPADADARLRPVLSRLRRALGGGRLEGRADLALAFPPDVWVDLEVVRAVLRRAREQGAAQHHAAAWAAAQEAAPMLEAGLLPGLEADWLEPYRTELGELRCELLETVARAGAHLGAAELVEAERAARRAVELSPLRETARAALLEVLARRGNTAEALVAYDDFRELLRDELGSVPGGELRALHERLLRADRAVPASPAPALPDRLVQAAAASFVGREAALGRLRAAAANAAAGAPEIVFVTGQGGIGKTRLLAELASELAHFTVLYGRCDEEQLFPYGPWVEVLRPAIGRLLDEDAEMLETAAPGLVRLLPELGARLPAPLTTSADDPETERRALFAAVTRILARLAQRSPLLVIIDDLHWADRSSLLLGRYLANVPDLGGVLLAGTFRDTELAPGHPLPELIADLERHRAVQRVRLGGMDDDEVGALIGSVHGPGADPPTVRAVRADTDGNPFFIKQLVRHREEIGLGLDAAGGAVPASVRDVIARRVARLPGDAGRTLGVAALIGREFDFELLRDVTALDDEALLDTLDAAVAGGLLTEVAPGRHSFAHALLRTTLEGELTRTRRGVWHKRIGEAIEARHGDALEPWLEELARHFGEAGPAEVARAASYAERAAAQATARLAYDEAVRLLRRAVSLRVDLTELARLERLLATAEAAAGQWEVARATFLRSAGTARTAGDAEAFAKAALGHGGGTWEGYGREDPASVALLEEALERLDPADSPLRVRLLARLAIRLYLSELREAEVGDIADDAVAMARRLGDRQALAAALVAMLFARWRPGRAAERLALTDELIAIAEGQGSLVEAADAHAWRAFALLELCRLDEAETHLERHAELVEQIQQPLLLTHRDALRATRAMLAGDYAAGVAAADAILARARQEEALGYTPASNHLGFHSGIMIVAQAERRDLRDLVPALQDLLRLLGRLPGFYGGIAWGFAQAGDPARAREALDALRADDFATQPRDGNFVTAMALAAHAVRELDAADIAAELEPQLAPYRDDWVVFPLGSGTLGPVAYSLGVVQLVQARADDAIASLTWAVDRSIAMRARPYVAHSRAALAEALRLRGGDEARAAELRAEALATARALGLVALERRLSS